jgi:hypothetical protein
MGKPHLTTYWQLDHLTLVSRAVGKEAKDYSILTVWVEFATCAVRRQYAETRPIGCFHDEVSAMSPH